jgi:hypothetical protein
MAMDDSIIWANKPIDKLSRGELAACAAHFRDAHVASMLRQAATLRRMARMEQALGRERLAKIDQWLLEHANSDAEKL